MQKLILDPYFGENSLKRMGELALSLTKEIFSPKDVGVTYTNINYWDRKGILNSQRENESQWRNFSFLDYVWIRVIAEMRDIGIPIEIIKEVKEELFSPFDLKPHLTKIKENIPEISKKINGSEEEKDELFNVILYEETIMKKVESIITNFFVAILLSIVEKNPISLVLFKSGRIAVWHEGLEEQYELEIRQLKLSESYISISISSIIKDFLVDKNYVYLLQNLKLLEPNEIRLMELIHSGNYDTISINFLDKKMKRLKLTKSQNPKKKMVDILQEGSYQDIEMKSHEGMITKITNTVKIILD